MIKRIIKFIQTNRRNVIFMSIGAFLGIWVPYLPYDFQLLLVGLFVGFFCGMVFIVFKIKSFLNSRS